MPNPIVTRRAYLDAALAIDRVLEDLDPERLHRMRRLGGKWEPPAGPALKNTDEVIVYLAEAVAASLERIAELEEAPARSRKKAAAK